jgi:hypothetical protein
LAVGARALAMGTGAIQLGWWTAECMPASFLNQVLQIRE